jgi:hypothetical protein
VLSLRETLQAQEAHVDVLEARLLDGTDDIDTLLDQLRSAHAKKAKVSATLNRKTTALGVSERDDLRRLVNSAFLRVRMNARALKHRIRDRLRHRKFELERLERSYWHTVNGMLPIWL